MKKTKKKKKKKGDKGNIEKVEVVTLTPYTLMKFKCNEISLFFKRIKNFKIIPSKL